MIFIALGGFAASFSFFAEKTILIMEKVKAIVQLVEQQ